MVKKTLNEAEERERKLKIEAEEIFKKTKNEAEERERKIKNEEERERKIILEAKIEAYLDVNFTSEDILKRLEIYIKNEANKQEIENS